MQVRSHLSVAAVRLQLMQITTPYWITEYLMDWLLPICYGYIRRLTVWNTRLADATLQALTAP